VVERKLGTVNRGRGGRAEIGVQTDQMMGGGVQPESVTLRLFPGARVEGVGDQNAANPSYVPCILPKGYATSVGAILYPYDESGTPFAALVPLDAVSKMEAGTGSSSKQQSTTCCTGKKHAHHHKHGHHSKHRHYNVNGNNGQERSMQHASHQLLPDSTAASASKTCTLL
jgi:hypothetical protein